MMIREMDTVCPLADLLSSPDLQVMLQSHLLMCLSCIRKLFAYEHEVSGGQKFALKLSAQVAGMSCLLRRFHLRHDCVDMQAQVCAAGALLNILGPELERSETGILQRKGFGKIMSCLLTLSIVQEAMFDDTFVFA